MGKGKAGWRVDGHRVYHVKGKKKSRKTTFKTKKAAMTSFRRRGRR